MKAETIGILFQIGLIAFAVEVSVGPLRRLIRRVRWWWQERSGATIQMNGQRRKVVRIVDNVVTVNRPWDPPPRSGDHFTIVLGNGERRIPFPSSSTVVSADDPEAN